MVRWCWIIFQCRGVLLIWIIVGQVPTALLGGVVWTVYSHLSFLVFKNWALFDLDSRRTDRLGARSVQLWIRSVVPPWEHRYGQWTKEKKTKKKEVIQK